MKEWLPKGDQFRLGVAQLKHNNKRNIISEFVKFDFNS